MFVGGVSIGAVSALCVMMWNGSQKTTKLSELRKPVNQQIPQATKLAPSTEAEKSSLAPVLPTQTQVEQPNKDNQTSFFPALENPINTLENSTISIESTPQEAIINAPSQIGVMLPNNESKSPLKIAKLNNQLPKSKVSPRNLEFPSNYSSNYPEISNSPSVDRPVEQITQRNRVAPITIENQEAAVLRQEYSSASGQEFAKGSNIRATETETQPEIAPPTNSTDSSSLSSQIDRNLQAEEAKLTSKFSTKNREVTLAESQPIKRQPSYSKSNYLPSEPAVIARANTAAVPLPVPTVANDSLPSLPATPAPTTIPVPNSLPSFPATPAPTTAPDFREPEKPRTSQQSNVTLRPAQLFFQGVYIQQNENPSLRGRISFNYAVAPNVLFGTTIDAVTGDAFTNNYEGLNLNELYVAFSPRALPNLRFSIGQLDLTSYFDRNSFAKDVTTHFFNQVFQTNPALSRSGVGTRPAILVNWAINDNIEAKAAVFSSDPDLQDFALNGFAGELGARVGNFIIRGTYVTNRDGGQNDGFREIYQIDRGGSTFGLLSDDSETAYGVNAELYIPQVRMGLFGRFGRYENRTLDLGGNTFNAGINLFDLFRKDDRLGIGYGQDLSNNNLRRQLGEKFPDVFEVFYDLPILPHLRVGFTFQGVDSFSEAILGFRIKTQFSLTPFERR